MSLPPCALPHRDPSPPPTHTHTLPCRLSLSWVLFLSLALIRSLSFSAPLSALHPPTHTYTSTLTYTHTHKLMKSRDIFISGSRPRDSNPGFRGNQRYNYQLRHGGCIRSDTVTQDPRKNLEEVFRCRGWCSLLMSHCSVNVCGIDVCEIDACERPERRVSFMFILALSSIR